MPLVSPRYDSDPLAADNRHSRVNRSTPTEAVTGLVVEEATTGWCGAVIAVEKIGGMRVVHLEDRRGAVRAFPLGPGFLLDGRPVELTPPAPHPGQRSVPSPPATRTASGSRAVPDAPARVARESRILVEGRHDAELVEKVWGDDLRIEGIVVELLEGVDNLPAYLADFAPNRSHRLGVLVDHLVPGSKESRIVAEISRNPAYARSVKVLGHPYVDVWQAVRPARLGLAGWPAVPRHIEWKHGILEHLGWEHATQADIAHGWRRILGTVRSYTDLEPALLAPVEELIDFVTVDEDETHR